MQNIYFLNYNNYFNRQVKRLNSVLEYYDYLVGNPVVGVNFNPNDNIYAEHIINAGWHFNAPNYAIVEDADTGEITRWFVIKTERTRLNQYKISLRRDCIADHLDNILNAPTFIEKAMLNNNDPMIFNTEDMQVNQIKQSEFLLTDNTNSAWIVAYIPKHGVDIEGAEGWEDRAIEVPSSKIEYNIVRNSIEDLKAEVERSFINDYEVQVDTKVEVGYREQYRRIVFSSLNGVKGNNQTIKSSLNSYFNTSAVYLSQLNTGIIEAALTNDYNLSNTNAEEAIRNLNGLNVKIGNDIYNIAINEEITSLQPIDPVLQTTNLYLDVKNTLDATISGTAGNIIDILSINKKTYKLILNRAVGKKCKFKISKTRESLRDAPYDMIAFPYPINQVKSGNINDNFEIDDYSYVQDVEATFAIASKLSAVLGNNVVYDVQVLPFCPCRDLIPGPGNTYIHVNSASQLDGRYSVIREVSESGVEGDILGIGVYCTSSSDTFNINFKINAATDKEVIMTDMYRLCDSNFTSAYELNVFENGGIDYFNVDFTYLPYQPWIKVNPNFKWLNGNDTNDSRGLIMSGNFSITRMDNAWADYQLANINYENIFNRQIKNMKRNYKYDKISNITAGVATAVGQGVGIGSLTGNAAAGVGMGAASLAGLAADTYLNDLKFKEAKSYSKDMYNYNLQNVQALPETISKLTAFNINSKYFPYIEYYTCTDEEKEAVRNKLKYNGMTVMRVGTINEFLKDDESFIQGQIIRMEDLTDNYNMSVEIADEIKQGIYIKRSDI